MIEHGGRKEKDEDEDEDNEGGMGIARVGGYSFRLGFIVPNKKV